MCGENDYIISFIIKFEDICRTTFIACMLLAIALTHNSLILKCTKLQETVF